MRLIGAMLIFAGLLLGSLVLFTAISGNKISMLIDRRHTSELAKQREADAAKLFYNHLGSAVDAEPPRIPAAPFGDGEKFTLEVDVANDRNAAINEVEKLAAQGVQAFFTPYERKGQIYYRIRLGIFSSQSDALQHSRELAIVKGMKTKLIQLQ